MAFSWWKVCFACAELESRQQSNNKDWSMTRNQVWLSWQTFWPKAKSRSNNSQHWICSPNILYPRTRVALICCIKFGTTRVQIVLCVICKSKLETHLSNVSSIFTRQDKNQKFELLACTSCGHIITFPTPSTDTIEKIYKDSYPYAIHHTIKSEKVRRAQNLIKFISLETRTSQTLLDLGCGEGELVQEAVKRGWQATGVDINAPSTRSGNETYIKSSIEDFALRPNNPRFDIIVMSHSLEHLSDHQKLLYAVEKHLLKDSGKLAIVVPNPYSITAQVFRRKWGYWQVPVHLHHFSVRSLQSTVESTGLQLVRRRFRGADSLFWILTLMNCLKAKSGEVTSVKMRIVRYLSWALTGYMYFGSEDIMMLFERRSEMASST